MASIPFPGSLLEDWLALSYGDAPSLALAAGGAFSTTSVYNWLKGKSWPSGDAMLKLFELGCNIHRFANPAAPLFSDTAQGRFYAAKAGREVERGGVAGSMNQAIDLTRRAIDDARAKVREIDRALQIAVMGLSESAPTAPDERGA